MEFPRVGWAAWRETRFVRGYGVPWAVVEAPRKENWERKLFYLLTPLTGDTRPNALMSDPFSVSDSLRALVSRQPATFVVGNGK
jgi:hypothetical protein